MKLLSFGCWTAAGCRGESNLRLPVFVPPDVHTEAVQAALAKHKERKMAVPMPSKRRSLVVQTSMDAYTPPGMEQSTHTRTHQPLAVKDVGSYRLLTFLFWFSGFKLVFDSFSVF